MKIFDCFPFFNELDQLEFRLKFLDKHVDHFVIAESNLTHSGHTKPYYFGESRDRFKRWEDKIIYIRVQQSRDGLVFEEQKSYDPSSASWKLEFEQRNALLEAASYMEDTDMVLLGDLDEVPFPPAIKKAVNTRKPVAFSLLFHVHYLNCQHAKELRWWQGCIAATAKQFREISPQGLRDNRDVYPSLPDAGWHFSYMGGPERIRQKLLAFAHTEYSGEEFSNEARLAFYIKNLPVPLIATRPLDEAISSAGGVAFEALNEGLMLKQLPGFFCAGEMLDWEAPTGGYLLTACFASGRWAGASIQTWLSGAIK